MEAAGFARIATMLGIHNLVAKGLLSTVEVNEFNETYFAHAVTARGFEWLLSNTDQINFHAPRRTLDGEIPF